MDEGLPFYNAPPVVETVLGVQFEPLEKFSNAHLGIFWKSLGEEWANVSDAAPIEPVFESFDAHKKWSHPEIQLRLSAQTHMRIQIKNVHDDRMIQLQNGRLHLNWRQSSPERHYPRYTKVREEFEDILRQFESFVATNNLGKIVMNQWELTYFNHIPPNQLWKSVRNWHNVIPGLVTSPGFGHDIQFENIVGEWVYKLNADRGRLHITLKHGRRQDNSIEVIVLQLTARGPISKEPQLSSGEGLDLGHKAIVCTFTEMTSPEAHKIWERKR